MLARRRRLLAAKRPERRRWVHKEQRQGQQGKDIQKGGFHLVGFEKLRLQVKGISCRSYEYMPLELRLTFSNLIGRRRSGENLVVLC